MRKNRKRIVVMAAAFILCAVLSACGKKEASGVTEGAVETQASVKEESNAGETSVEETQEQQGERTEQGTTFGEFRSQDLEGNALDQEIFTKADLTMVNIWGTFCSPCVREMPDLGDLNREYQDQGFQIVGIISDVAEAKDASATKIVEKTKADYTQILVSEEMMNGYLSTVSVIPTTIFVDRNGKQVGEVYVGAKSRQQWADIISQLLDETKK